MSCCVLCQVAGSDRVMSVGCNVWCCRIGVHTVCVSGIFLFLFFFSCWTNSRLAAWTQCLFVLKHAVCALGFTSYGSVLSERNPVNPLQDCLMMLQSVGTIKNFALRMHSWTALKIWGSCTSKTIVSSKWLTLNFTSWHCSVRRGMNTTTNCAAFMVLSSVTGDGRKFSVRCFYVVYFMQMHWLMACNEYITIVQKLWISMLYK